MCKVSRGSEDHLVQGLADFGSFSQKMPLNKVRDDNTLACGKKAFIIQSYVET